MLVNVIVLAVGRDRRAMVNASRAAVIAIVKMTPIASIVARVNAIVLAVGRDHRVTANALRVVVILCIIFDTIQPSEQKSAMSYICPFSRTT